MMDLFISFFFPNSLDFFILLNLFTFSVLFVTHLLSFINTTMRQDCVLYIKPAEVILLVKKVNLDTNIAYLEIATY